MDYSAVQKLIDGSTEIVITTHRSPDGDAMGSALALYMALTINGAKAKVIVPNSYPAFLAWMPNANDAVIFEKEPDRAEEITASADLIFCLDFNDLSRLAKYGDVVEKAQKPMVLIDHHISPADYFTQSLSDTSASSTCELIHRFFEGMGWLDVIDTSIAESLYTGIMTDTGSFRFSSTSASTHRIVADLMDRGLVPEKVYNSAMDTNRYERLQLVGHILSKKMDYRAEIHTAIIPLTLQEKNRFHYQKGDTEGVVNYGLSIKGSRMAIFISEEDGYCKMSLRSKGSLDVNKIARKHFNGGGHMNAAGGRLDLSLKETLERIQVMLDENRNLLQ